ncbi:hypothetical protein GQX74_015316 [Glossina fuscipes]|nr:hypothetical protein GQX74_015316 [Glossina fuscipes]
MRPNFYSDLPASFLLCSIAFCKACASASRADISRAFNSSSELVLRRAQSGNSFSGKNGVSVPVVPMQSLKSITLGPPEEGKRTPRTLLPAPTPALELLLAQ